MVWSAIVMEANWRYKGNIQETYKTAKSWNWFRKKGPSKTLWKERESRFGIQKPVIPVCERWKDSCMTPLRQVLLVFFIFLFWWLKILKIILWRLWVCKKMWIRHFTPSSFTVVNSALPPTKFFKLAIARWHSFEMQMI